MPEARSKARTRLVTLFFLLLAAGLFTPLTLNRIPSADLWWLLAGGRLTTALGHPISTNPFSFTTLGQHWQNDSWVVSWLFYQIYAVGGLTALQLLKWLLLTTTFLVSVWHAARRVGGARMAALAAGLGCMAFSQHGFFFDVRAYLFTYLFLAIFWGLLWEYAHSRKGTLLWAFPLLTVVWVNLHTGVTAGIAMLFAAAVGLALQAGDRELALPMAGAAVASLIAATLNLSGVAVLTLPFRLLDSMWSRHLNEWQPLIVNGSLQHRFIPYVLFAAATMAVCMLQRHRLHRFEGLVLLAFACLSMSGWRHIPLFCLLAIRPWTVVLSGLLRRPADLRAYAASGLAAIAFAGWTLGTTDLARLSLEDAMFPRWAARFLAANHLPPRLFEPYGWGGYLIFRLYPGYRVFIDGRAVQAYTTRVYADYLTIATDRPGAEHLLKKWDVETAVVFRDPRVAEGSSRLFAASPDWVRVYRDDLAAVYLRRCPQTRRALERFRHGQLIYPPSPYSLVERARKHWRAGKLAAAAEALRQALSLDRDYAPAYFVEAGLALQTGRRAEAIRLLHRTLKLDPTMPNAHLVLALQYERTDQARALQQARDELRLNPESRGARALIRRLKGAPK